MKVPHLDLQALHQLFADAPMVVRLVVSALGVIILAWGARIYRPALLMGAFGAGAVVTVVTLNALAPMVPAVGEPAVVAVTALVGGALLAGLASAVHQAALVGVGAVAGLVLAGAVAGLVTGVPWWALPLGAVCGAIALPLLFQTVLKVTMPLVGAVLVSWAVGLPFNPVTVIGLWVVGALFQLGFGRGEDRRKDREQEAEA